jgi:hypothetical protein
MELDLLQYIFLENRNGRLSLIEIVIRSKFNALETAGIWTLLGHAKEEGKAIIHIAQRNA